MQHTFRLPNIKEVVMISDYVDPTTYSDIEIVDEQKYLKLLPKQIKRYGLKFKYIEVNHLRDLKSAIKTIDKNSSIIFNWCDNIGGVENTAHLVTEELENAGLVFTGSNTKCLKLNYSKEKTKQKLIRNHIPTPSYNTINSTKHINKSKLRYPLIVKLEDRHASEGLELENLVRNRRQLIKVATRLLDKHKTRLLLEKFVSGQEYTVTIWGNGKSAECLYITKEIYKNKEVSNIYTATGKFAFGSAEEANLKSASYHYKKSKKTIDLLIRLALKSYRILGMSDYARFDIREERGKYYVIDCNANPWVCIGSQVLRGGKRLGYNYGETILKICEFALQRKMK